VSAMSILERPWRLAAAAAVACALSLAGCMDGENAVADLDDVRSEAAQYRLGPGDVVKVTVFNRENLSGEYKVDGQGRISMPLIANVDAVDATAEELERRIVDKLKPDYMNDPQVNVDVAVYRPFFVLGEVQEPGSYPYREGMTVFNATAVAGGFTYRANKHDFYIRRSIDTDARTRIAERETLVLPGDTVIVRERTF
jgi:protein involved in polysaccharide export with SLBB domain